MFQEDVLHPLQQQGAELDFLLSRNFTMNSNLFLNTSEVGCCIIITPWKKATVKKKNELKQRDESGRVHGELSFRAETWIRQLISTRLTPAHHVRKLKLMWDVSPQLEAAGVTA